MNTFDTATDSLYVGTANFNIMDEATFNEHINSLFPNPYEHPGGFWGAETEFLGNFEQWAWNESMELAQMTPDGQMPPGFGGQHLVNAINESNDAFYGYMETLQNNSEIYGDIHQDWVGYIGGWQTVVDPSTGQIFPYAPDTNYVGYDPVGQQILGFDTPIEDPNWIPLEPIDSFYSGWGVDSFAASDFGGNWVV
ncbi:MAG: hypothetical protein AAGE96_18880 [Cyanobacteria bacterium P01_G01_bin.19]